MNRTTVNIHGKEYETVASRVKRFRETYKQDYSIETELVEQDDARVIMKASIRNLESAALVATGYAEEKRASSQINRTSALENCETSAIGRALAAFGMAGTEYASADEVANAISQRSAPAPSRPAVGSVKPVAIDAATPVQKRQIAAFLQGLGVQGTESVKFLEDEFGIIPGTVMTQEDAANIIKELRSQRYPQEEAA